MGRRIAQHVLFNFFVHFLAFLYKTTTLNHKKLRHVMRTETTTANYLSFHLELNASH